MPVDSYFSSGRATKHLAKQSEPHDSKPNHSRGKPRANEQHPSTSKKHARLSATVTATQRLPKLNSLLTISTKKMNVGARCQPSHSNQYQDEP